MTELITKGMMETKFDNLIVVRSCNVSPKGVGKPDKTMQKKVNLSIDYTGCTLADVLEQSSARITITVQNGMLRPKFDTFKAGANFTYKLADAGKREPLTEEKKIDNGFAAFEARAKANGTTIEEEFMKELAKRNQ